jgi:hypothetical protein
LLSCSFISDDNRQQHGKQEYPKNRPQRDANREFIKRRNDHFTPYKKQDGSQSIFQKTEVFDNGCQGKIEGSQA